MNRSEIERILKAVWDEFSPEHGWIDIWAVPNVEYVLSKGCVFIFHQHDGMTETHAAVPKDVRGRTAIKAAKKALITAKKKYGKIVAKIELHRKNVLLFAKQAGMKLFKQDKFYWLEF